jgi:tetratricopeptide (TPR) repeat protein
MFEGDHFYSWSLDDKHTGATATQARNDSEAADTDQFTGACPGSSESIRMPRDLFNHQVTLPDGRDVLGLSMCDLTCNRIALDVAAVPVDFPPLPKCIKIPDGITSESIRRPILELFSKWPRTRAGWNLGRITASDAETAGYRGPAPLDKDLEVLIPGSLMAKIGRVSSLASENPDYDCRLAVLGLQYQHEYRVKPIAESNSDSLDNGKSEEVAMLERVLRFKELLAAKIPTTGTVKVREARASQLEAAGNGYEALFERLKIEEMAANGPSHFRIALLYRSIGEDKLAFEKLKEAVESDWPAGDAHLLASANKELADVLMKAYGTAVKVGNRDLALGRLRNASTAYRQSFLLNTNDTAALEGLRRTAHIATVEEPCFDNYLMLGGAQLLSGQLEKAQEAYKQCAALNPNNPLLKQARKVYRRYEMQRPSTSISQSDRGLSF